MRILQRVALIVLVLAGIMIGWKLLYTEQKEKISKQWEALQTEKFMKKICRNGYCSYEEFALYEAALNGIGKHSTVRLEEAQREWDLSGKVYYYQISWEEIEEQMIRTGIYDFQEESILKVSVNKGNYYDIVFRKD